MSAIAVLRSSRCNAIQHRIIREGSQQLEMAFTRLMHAGEDRVGDT